MLTPWLISIGLLFTLLFKATSLTIASSWFTQEFASITEITKIIQPYILQRSLDTGVSSKCCWKMEPRNSLKIQKDSFQDNYAKLKISSVSFRNLWKRKCLIFKPFTNWKETFLYKEWFRDPSILQCCKWKTNQLNRNLLKALLKAPLKALHF